MLAKASVAFTISTLGTFVTEIDKLLQGSGYFVTLAILFFHPCRSVGAMTEALLLCMAGLFLGYTLSQACLMLVEYYDTLERSMTEAHFIGIGSLSLITFSLAMIRAKGSPVRAAIGTACSLVHIQTFATITQMAMEDAFAALPARINLICISMFSGTLLSFLCCCTIFPQTASFQLQEKTCQMMFKFKDFFDTIHSGFLPQFLHEHTGDERAVDLLERLVKEQDKALVDLETKRYESLYEPFSRVFWKRRVYTRICNSLERLVLHAGSLKTTLVSVSHDTESLLYTRFFSQLRPAVTDLSFACGVTAQLLGDCLQQCPKTDALLPQLEAQSLVLAQATLDFKSAVKALFDTLNAEADTQVYQLFFFVFGIQELASELEGLLAHVQSLLLSDKNLKLQPHLNPSVVKVNAHHVTPGLESNDHFQPLMRMIWSFMSNLKLYEFKYALKTSFTITLMAVPAFLDTTKDVFYKYRLSWAMSSAIVVMSYSVGGTNAAGLYRIFGTMGGIAASIAIWCLFPDQPVGLFIASGLISIPCFYAFFYSKYPKVGQIFLLTYAIILLQKYSALEDPVLEKTFTIYEIAFRRGLVVLLGVFIGIFVSWFIWPFRARTALRKGISRIYQDLSALLIKLMSLINSETLPDLSNAQEFLQQELRLRMALSESLRNLKETALETRLKGRFSQKTYAEILQCLDHILNRLESIRLGVSKQDFPRIRMNSIHPLIDTLCREMVGQILLYLYVLSGAMQLKTPLPPKLPDASGARDRLLEAVKRLNRPDTPFYLAYVLEDVIVELDHLGKLTKTLFGEIQSLSF